MKIPPHLMSEANVQAEVYGVCKASGMNVSLEVITPVGRLDVGVFSVDWSRLLAIVECKQPATAHRGGRQMIRYESIGVPVFKWSKMDCRELLRALLAVPTEGVLWEKVKAMPKKDRRKKHKFNPETDLDESLIYRSN